MTHPEQRHPGTPRRLPPRGSRPPLDPESGPTPGFRESQHSFRSQPGDHSPQQPPSIHWQSPWVHRWYPPGTPFARPHDYRLFSTRAATVDDPTAAVRRDRFISVREVSECTAEGPDGWGGGGDMPGVYAFQQDWIKARGDPADMVLMSVMSDRMEPTVRRGDQVLIDTSRKHLRHEAVMAVVMDDRIQVVRVARSRDAPGDAGESAPGRLWLVGDNSLYPPLEVRAERVSVLGEIVWLGRWL